jgi:hypothetical protein
MILDLAGDEPASRRGKIKVHHRLAACTTTQPSSDRDVELDRPALGPAEVS